MFLKYYGFRAQPFGVTPDPRFLYLTHAHREALASLYYGIDAGRGFMAFIAKPGMGKTTLLFHLLQRLQSTSRTAFLFQTQCDSREFMRFLLHELDCEVPSSPDIVSMHEEFNRCLVQESHAGRRVVLVVDEAQNLDPAVLETIRLLSDFETPNAKLLQIILSGQPELADKLARPTLRQLRQRISIICTIAPLRTDEVDGYIKHRLAAAGRTRPLFTAGAIRVIAELSEGIPRNVSNICFSALSLGCALQAPVIDVAIVQQVEADLDISMLRSEPGVTSGPRRATLPSDTRAALVAKQVLTRIPEAFTSKEALLYLQEIVHRLKDNERPAN